ncbi:MAG TPA: hypothetical protein VI365_32610, partial [Trebonia sp.]
MGNVADPCRRLAGADLLLRALAAHPRPASGHQQVLGDARAVRRRVMRRSRQQAQAVDLYRVTAGRGLETAANAEPRQSPTLPLRGSRWKRGHIALEEVGDGEGAQKGG